MISLWLFVGFVSLCCRQATTKSTGDDIQPAVQLSGKSRWNLVKDKHQHAEKSFIKPLEKKPTLERVSTVISQSQSLGKIPKVDQRSKPRLPSINANRQANTSRSVFTMETVCSPERYIVRLRHGNCTRIVETTVRSLASACACTKSEHLYSVCLIIHLLVDVLRFLQELHSSRLSGVSFGGNGTAQPRQRVSVLHGTVGRDEGRTSRRDV